MRLLITRPVEDSQPLKAKLEALGHQTITAPLLTIVPMPDVEIPAANYQLIALTSANVVRCLANNPALGRLRFTRVLAVGPQSADAARRAGFTDVDEAGGDAVGLAGHIAASRDPAGGPLLYLSGRETASDFAGRLQESGFVVTRVIAYQAEPALALPADARSADGVVLFSPRSARIWLDLAGTAKLEAARMVHYCLSANVAAILPDGFVTRIAARPTEAALLETIGRA